MADTDATAKELRLMNPRLFILGNPARFWWRCSLFGKKHETTLALFFGKPFSMSASDREEVCPIIAIPEPVAPRPAQMKNP
jgi:hypothetical protein